jgi:hypothetical protein
MSRSRDSVLNQSVGIYCSQTSTSARYQPAGLTSSQHRPGIFVGLCFRPLSFQLAGRERRVDALRTGEKRDLKFKAQGHESSTCQIPTKPFMLFRPHCALKPTRYVSSPLFFCSFPCTVPHIRASGLIARWRSAKSLAKYAGMNQADYAAWETKVSTQSALSVTARILPTLDGDTTFTCLTETHYDTESGSGTANELRYIHISMPSPARLSPRSPWCSGEGTNRFLTET